MRVATGIFFASSTLFVLYLLSVRWNFYSSAIIFWATVAVMLGSVIYQILKIELFPSYAPILVLEIAAIGTLFHLIYQIPYYGLRGFDAYRDMASAKGILSSGFVMGDPQYVNDTSYFPIIHIFGAMLSSVTGINLFSVAKWFPSFLNFALVPLLYLLIQVIIKDQKIALLSALMFVCLQHYILFSSLFVRETLALVLAVCCVYLYFSAAHSSHPSTKYALSILCLIVTVFAHHLTSFLLMIFLSFHFLVTKASEISFLRRAYFVKDITGEKIRISFIAIGFVTLFSYWTFVATSPFFTLYTFARDIFTSSRWGVNTYAETSSALTGSPTLTIRGAIELYGFFFFLFIFSLVLLYRLLPRAKNDRIETYSFTLFFFFCGLIGFVNLYFVEAAAFPDRFLMYGWLFGFAALAVAILKGKHKWLRKIAVVLVVASLLFNIYIIDPTAWDARAEERGTTEVSVQDYALANRFNFSTGTILGDSNALLAIYDVHNNLGNFLYFTGANVTWADWVIVSKIDMEMQIKYLSESSNETITALAHLETEDSGYNRIYESGNLIAYRSAK